MIVMVNGMDCFWFKFIKGLAELNDLHLRLSYSSISIIVIRSITITGFSAVASGRHFS